MMPACVVVFFVVAHVARSADGTTVITSTSDNSIISYVLPGDLLDPRQDGQPESDPQTASASDAESESGSDSDSDSESGSESGSGSSSSGSSSSSSSSSSSPSHHRHRRLVPQGRLSLPEPAHALASAPYYSLALPWSQSVLVSCRDLPIQLHPLFPEDGDSSCRRDRPCPLASYPLIKTETEAYLAPNALLWPSPGTHFVAGTTNLLALFDVSRTANHPPLLRVPTIASTRHLRKGNGVGMRGTIAALSGSIGPGPGPGPGLVAAGTWTRWVGLYDLARAGGDCVATWSVAGAGADAIDGGGILQTLWSPCGRYLVVNERRSQGLLVYDVRGSGELLCRLTGRPAETNQRLSCDVYMSASAPSEESVSTGNGSGGFEVWAGTQDGKTVVWEGVGCCDGNVEPSWSWASHASAVGSTAMHASGSVIATCSGSWTLSGDGDSPETDDGSDNHDAFGHTTVRTSADTSLKLWTLA